MITIACMYHCDIDDCGVKVPGRIEPRFLTVNGRPAGFQLNPHLPAGWTVGAPEAKRIQTPGSAGQTQGVLANICTKCTKAIEAKAAQKPSGLIVEAG